MAIIIKKEGNLEYLTAEGIGSPHAFTTRLGGVSEGIFASLNFGISRGDDPKNVAENYRILADAVGFDLKKLVLTRQTHTDIVRVVTETFAITAKPARCALNLSVSAVEGARSV